MPSDLIHFDEFLRVDIRVGQVTAAEPFPKARKPAYKLWIDFGTEVGIKQSSAQITEHYTPEDLVGRKVLAVVNLAPRQVADFMSECLTLGVYDAQEQVRLIGLPDQAATDVPLGARLC